LSAAYFNIFLACMWECGCHNTNIVDEISNRNFTVVNDNLNIAAK